MVALLSRFGRRVAALFSGRRLTSSRIVNGVEAEARWSARADRPKLVTTRPDLVTALATSFAGVWSMPRLVARASKVLRGLRGALVGAQSVYDRSFLTARMLLTDPVLPELEKQYRKVITTVHDRETTMRAQHLWLGAYVVSLIVVAVVDWLFFFFLLMDVQNASPSSPTYGLVVLSSATMALITPLAVIVISDWGGRRVARFRFQVRDLFDKQQTVDKTATPESASTLSPAMRFVSLAAVPTLIVVGLAGLVVFFAIFAQHRFEGLSQQVGATTAADPVLLSSLLAILPIVSFLGSLFRHDIPTQHTNTILKKWKKLQERMAANQHAVADAMLAWVNAWDGLYDKVSQIVAEAQVSVQTVEHLLLLGLARTNQRGETAYSVDAILKPTPDATPTLGEALTTLAGTGRFFITTPEPITTTVFPTPAWVMTELEISLQWLVNYLPVHDHRVEERVQRLLDLAHPNTPATPSTDLDTDTEAEADTGADTAGAQGQSDTALDAGAGPSDVFDPGEFEKLLNPSTPDQSR